MLFFLNSDRPTINKIIAFCGIKQHDEGDDDDSDDNNNINPSAWSAGHCPHTVNITCRGVTGTAHMLHALTHSSISRQVREQM